MEILGTPFFHSGSRHHADRLARIRYFTTATRMITPFFLGGVML